VIVYLDASALVKQYVAETGSEAVGALIEAADVVGTSLISRAEVVAALAKAVRVGLLERSEASGARTIFATQWSDVVRLQLTETVVTRAGDLAWEHDLRGYDAVHLAAALFWQETLGESVTMATFDRQLWEKGEQTGLAVWPPDLEKHTRR
jgi:predicted nucleic acid-binding protein